MRLSLQEQDQKELDEMAPMLLELYGVKQLWKPGDLVSTKAYDTRQPEEARIGDSVVTNVTFAKDCQSHIMVRVRSPRRWIALDQSLIEPRS